MKQQPVLGFIFALITAMAWGTLPIFLKQVVVEMQVETIVWYRFITATIALFILLALTKKLPNRQKFNRTTLFWFLLGVLGLAGNFFLFNSSLAYIDAPVAQIFIHLSSFVMLLFGVLLFKEKLGWHQKLGLAILMVGLGFFFNDRFAMFASLNIYSLGVILSILGALVWVIYGLAQKVLLRYFTAQQILLLIYLGCALVFTPFAQPASVQSLSPFALGCLVYCCLNTLFGYGAYAEALNRWDVSKVSVVVTLVPLFTILFSHILFMIAPDNFHYLELNTMSYIGSVVVVIGAMLSAIGHKLFNKRKE